MCVCVCVHLLNYIINKRLNKVIIISGKVSLFTFLLICFPGNANA